MRDRHTRIYIMKCKKCNKEHMSNFKWPRCECGGECEVLDEMWGGY